MLADKIIELRKKNGWSQEQLGEQLGVSRQSVSKWETGLAVPELDNIMQMSTLFGVSIDYLLKEGDSLAYSEDSSLQSQGEKENGRHIDHETAVDYLELVRRVASRIAWGVSLCILSPIPMLLMAGYAEGFGGMSEDFAGGIGVAILLVIVACGVLVLVWNGMKLSPYNYLEEENIMIDAKTAVMVKDMKKEYETRFRASHAIGVVLCVLGVVPLFVATAFDPIDFVYVCAVSMLLFMVAIAVQFFIRAGMPQGSYQKLLQEGDYTKENKAIDKKLSFLPGAYWCSVVALFLIFGFFIEEWKTAGYIWPVAGVLFAVVWCVASAIAKKQEK